MIEKNKKLFSDDHTEPRWLGANTIVILGNSIAAQDTPVSISGTLPTGCFLWANYMLRQRFDIVHSSTDLFAGYLGAGGETSAQILARIGSVIALAPMYCLLLGVMENDVENNITAATTQSNISSMITRLLNAEIVPIICTGLASLLTSTSVESNLYYSNNAFIRNLPLLNSGIIAIDISHESVDYTQMYPMPLVTDVVSGPHPNELLAYKIGKKIYQVLDSKIPERPIFSNHWLSVANGGDTPDSVVDNPLLLGNAGAIVAPLTGVVCDGWTGNAVGGTSGLGSKVARADLPLLEWQQIDYTGDATYVYGSDYARIYSTQVALPSCGLAVGDDIQAFGEFEFDAGDTALLGAELMVRCVNGATEYYRGFQRNASLIIPIGEDYPAGVIATPKLTIPVGTTTLQIQMRAHAAAIDAAFVSRFGRSIIHKL